MASSRGNGRGRAARGPALYQDQGPARHVIYDPHLHGSAEWGEPQHFLERGYGPDGDHLLGYAPAAARGGRAVPVTYDGHRHQLIVGPTRSGKGVSGAIPRLFDHRGGAIVLDVKDGELARATAFYRSKILGQDVRLIDPYDVVASDLGMETARLNPIDAIDLDSDDAFDQAMLIAEACVLPEGRGDAHWDGEAEALIAGLCLFEAQNASDHGGNLAGVRANLNRSAAEWDLLLAEMMASPYRLVRDAAARIESKADRERSGVISTAQRHTHFLESGKLAGSLSATDFDLGTIGDNTAIYIVLPARRLRTARRWLRVVLSVLIHAVTALPSRPAPPVLFVLDEMAALGKLDIVLQSFGLMAGYGLQMLGIVQDFSQLKDLYGERWQTFIANSGTTQCFGTNDHFTAKYLSDLCGIESVETVSAESARVRASLFGDPAWRSAEDSLHGRALITPDELMSLHPAVQVTILAAARPFIGYRPVYYLDARYRDRRGRPLFPQHPDHADKPIPRAVDFTRTGLDLGAVLAPHLKVG